MKRLKAPTGNLSDSLTKESDSLDRIVRRAVLVHSGPEGSIIGFYTGDYDAETDPAEGDITFDDDRIKNIEKNHNEKINKLADDYGGMDKMPDGAFPPLLDQHDDDSVHRVIGRLASEVKYEVMDVPGVGKNCSCLTADLTFLGKEIVERANDGRIFHLSVGIDETTDTIGELSAVIIPAAPGARLLKKGDKTMSTKKLEAHKKRLSSLKAMKESLSTVTKKVVAANEKAKLAGRAATVTHRLTGLVRGGKITPAELKKMDVKKLATLTDENINTMMSAFEAMEPKVLAGQRGSTAAVEFASIGTKLKSKELKNLKSEVMGDFKRLGKKLKGSDDEEEVDDKKLEEVKKEEVKDMGAEIGAHLDVGSEEMVKSSSEVQAQIDELNTQVARIAGMVEELIKEEEAEMSEGFGEEGVKAVDESKKAEAVEGEESKLSQDEEEKKKLAQEEEDKKKLAAEKEEVKKQLTGKKTKTK